MARCWESSPHVSHFHRHPDEYVEAVLKFLTSVGLTKSDEVKMKRSVGKSTKEVQQALQVILVLETTSLFLKTKIKS